MTLEAVKFSGWIDGEFPIDTSGTDHVAGQPAKITSSGLALATNPEEVIGLFKSDMYVDVAGGPQAADAPATGFSNAGILCGPNRVKMTAGKLKTGAAQTPFKAVGSSSHTWAVGNRLFLASDGTWDNAPAASNDPPFGVVTKAPTADDATLEAIMDPMNGALYSAITT